MAKAKEIEGLDCEASASAGIQLVVRTRLEEMCAFRAAALAYEDPEGVHDMRVASRRLRGLIKDFSSYFRSRKFHHAKADLKNIADALGAVRDQDVAIMALEKLATEAPAEIAAGIEEFTNERRLKRDHARSELEEALKEDALRELQEEFNSALGQGLKVPRARKSKGENQKSTEELSFRQVGHDIITAALLELQDLSESLSRPLKTKPLHEMRLAAKRLRYAIELFASCWEESLEPFAKEIARLQTSLGELHDCDVWIAELGAAWRKKDTRLEETPEAQGKRAAAVWLLDYFVKERADHFRDALARWHEWETKGFHSSLTEIKHDFPS
jgi:CHAD domain-containing protein